VHVVVVAVQVAVEPLHFAPQHLQVPGWPGLNLLEDELPLPPRLLGGVSALLINL
jgi:hypothetical protein